MPASIRVSADTARRIARWVEIYEEEFGFRPSAAVVVGHWAALLDRLIDDKKIVHSDAFRRELAE